ncbi:MAG: flagellar hook protein FlgE, partial [Treponema sp.]|nr:flagellar hook protein FlgE [Treponema sp.]
PTEEKGGVNPKEVGLGMTVAAIDTVFTQGNLQSTGISTDVAIQGNGFFIEKNGEKSYYTRAGAFSLDQNGTLVNPANGMRVQGWMARELNGEMVVQTAATPTDLVIPVGSKDPAKATQNINFACNLNKNTPEIPENPTEADIAKGTWNTEFKIYDSFGNEHLLNVSFRRVTGNPNQWDATVIVDPDTENLDAAGTPQNPTRTRVGFGSTNNGDLNTFRVYFDNNGTLARVTDGVGAESNLEGEIILQASYDVPDSNTVPDENGQQNPYRQTMNINLGTIGSMINTVTQSASASSTKAFYQDGYTLGYLENFKIDSTGSITGVYSNGTNRTIGQLAMATFANQNGLEKAGDNTYVKSNNSGEAKINAAGIAGGGTFLAGALEMSNVDLTEQFTDMIVTQRGFQSNAKTIQTADTLLETVLSLKR